MLVSSLLADAAAVDESVQSAHRLFNFLLKICNSLEPEAAKL